MVRRAHNTGNSSQNGIRPRNRKSGSHESSFMYVNDDAAEKENRRQSSNNHSTSRRHSLVLAAREMQNSGTAEKSAPVLANFEQWMKLVKDNKINATNSWNFALIDYFHDMSLLKDGDGINFQKASYTLDGCVKIYTSRIDSVASETGKLLSGLAESAKQKQRAGDEVEDHNNEDPDAFEDGDEEEGDGESAKKKAARKRKSAKAESTLARSYASLQVKKLDLELSIDPLFRKMCADFDEGGAKGLLLNSLVIDDEGRVVFDGELNKGPKGVDFGDGVKPLFAPKADDDEAEEAGQEEEEEEEEGEANDGSEPVDIDSLRNRFFPDLYEMDALEVCPSVYNIDAALKDPSLMSTALAKEMEKMEVQRSSAGLGDDMGDGDIDALDDIDLDANFDDYAAVGFEADADANDSLNANTTHGSTGGTFFTNGNGKFVLNSVGTDQDILSYFDETLKKNWAGPEHWKIQKLKGSILPPSGQSAAADTDVKPALKKAAKEPFMIDFLSDENEIDEKELFAPTSTGINLTKAQQKSKDANLLPNDQHFTSQNLIRLFLKPKGRIFHKLFGQPQANREKEEELDQHYWASQYSKEGEDIPAGNYDADFFHDDDGGDAGPSGDLGGGDFFDEDYGAEQPLVASSQANAISSSRSRPEYVNYARTAKRVNIKLLKNNLWKKMDMKDVKEGEEIKFTDVVQELKEVYPGPQLSEISTSFCFICALHLANEKGLIIEDNENHDELSIKWDPTATNLREESTY